jgi:hypothetical protein
LPKVAGKLVILTVVDRFSKYAHFIPLGHPYTVASVARAFFDGIVRPHKFPSSIVSDRDPVFTGHVWCDLFGMVGVKLRMSTAFHPQTNGQSEVVNKVIPMYLRCVAGDRPRSWVDWLSWVEYCYNTSFHTALRATPFEVVYGRPPPHILPYTTGTAKTEAPDSLLRSRDEMLTEVRQCLLQAQQLSKKYYDANHRDLEFSVGDWVWLRLLHRTAQSLGRSRWTPRLGASWGLPMQGRSGCLSASVPLHTVFSCRTAPASTTSSMSGYSSRTAGPPAAPGAMPPLLDGRILPEPEGVLRAEQRRRVWYVHIRWRVLVPSSPKYTEITSTATENSCCLSTNSSGT